MHLLSDARPLGAVAAHVLTLFVVVSQPVASLAWFGGMHTTLEQASLHQAAVAHGHNHHHGVLEPHEHHEHRDDNTDFHVSRSILGPELASAAPYAGSFQDLLQTLFQAMLAVLADTPSPGEQPRQASPAKDLPSQHSPSVPHRPPILLPLTLTIV
jgi:hypothetical protein